MPIYAYKCDACGFAKDVLQKMSDPLLSECPNCGKCTFTKQLTAAGFQLKGSGWYATDFKGSGSGSGAAAASGSPAADGAASSGDAAVPAATAAAPAAQSGCGAACGCHS